MAAIRSRFRPFRSVCLALLALGTFGCQSDGAEGDEADTDDEAAEPAEPNAVIRVPERETAASESSASPTSDPPEQSPSEGGAEPAATDNESALAPAATFAACTSDGGAYSDCETIFVTVVQSSLDRCIQLTIDNCGTYGRQGLSGADTPFEWRLAGGTVSSSASPCELGAFYSGSTSLANATGSITWDETARTPTDVTFDLTLELLAAGEGEAIELSTPTPLQPTPCDE